MKTKRTISVSIFAALLAVSMLFSLTACGTDEAKEKVTEKIEQVSEEVKDAVEDAKDKAEDVIEDVKDTVEDVKDTAEDVVEDAKDAVDDLVEDAKNTAEDVIGDIEDAVEDAEEKAEDIAKDAKDAVEDIVDEAKDAVEGDETAEDEEKLGVKTLSKEAQAGRSFSFFVEIPEGMEVKSYKWMRCIGEENEWENVERNATASTERLQIAVVKGMDGYRFKCVVAFADGSVMESEESVLSVR